MPLPISSTICSLRFCRSQLADQCGIRMLSPSVPALALTAVSQKKNPQQRQNLRTQDLVTVPAWKFLLRINTITFAPASASTFIPHSAVAPVVDYIVDQQHIFFLPTHLSAHINAPRTLRPALCAPSLLRLCLAAACVGTSHGISSSIPSDRPAVPTGRSRAFLRFPMDGHKRNGIRVHLSPEFRHMLCDKQCAVRRIVILQPVESDTRPPP